MRENGNIRGFLAGIGLAVLAGVNFRSASPAPEFVPPASASAPSSALPFIEQRPESKLDLYIEAYVTGYNTVPTQTDGDPCVAASGVNICGRRDTIACPPLLPFGTVVEVRGKTFVCEDRMARKFRGRFDINCDKDMRCPYKVAGQMLVKVLPD